MPFITPHFWKKKKKSLFHFLKRDWYLVKTPGWLRRFYPGCTWHMPDGNKTLYLSFDDGPHPTITPFVLDTLQQYQAKATFFCIGNNAAAHPEIYNRLSAEGHSVGNHTHNHLNGWKTKTEDYIADFEQAAQYIYSPLFRPPYGRISKKQLQAFKLTHPQVQVIMWTVLAGDWEPHLAPEQCYEQVKKATTDGSIIVFHDSEKSFDRMAYALPRILDYFSKEGYRFEKI
jgi:peptidoglycan-N-acetylglucosamine deacetylase